MKSLKPKSIKPRIETKSLLEKIELKQICLKPKSIKPRIETRLIKMSEQEKTLSKT